MFKLYKLCMLLSVILLAGCSKPEYTGPLHAIDVGWQHPVLEFHLKDTDGKPRSLEDYRGKVVIMFFGYTHCPEVCPTTLADLAHVMRMLGEEAKNIQVLFVTLDPERDTPEVLSKFIPSFDPSFVALSGDKQAIAKAAKSFGVNYEKHMDKHGGYTVDHTDSTYLIGRTGRPIWMSRYGQRGDFLVQDIKLLLAMRH